MNRQGMNDPERHFTAFRRNGGARHGGLESPGAVNHRLELGHGAGFRVLAQRLPIAVKGDESGMVQRNRMIEDFLCLIRQNRQNVPLLLTKANSSNEIEVVGMDGKKGDEFVHARQHVAVVFGKGRQVSTNCGLLFGCLSEQTVPGHKASIGAGNGDRNQAVLGLADELGDEPTSRVVGRFLAKSGDKPEVQAHTSLTDLAKEAQVALEGGSVTAAEVMEQFIDQKKQAATRELSPEGSHQVGKPGLRI